VYWRVLPPTICLWWRKLVVNQVWLWLNSRTVILPRKRSSPRDYWGPPTIRSPVMKTRACETYPDRSLSAWIGSCDSSLITVMRAASTRFSRVHACGQKPVLLLIRRRLAAPVPKPCGRFLPPARGLGSVLRPCRRPWAHLRFP